MLATAQAIRTGHAAGETYTLTATPSRVIEGYAPGVHLVLTVTNSQPGPYVFTWTVTDPSGTTRSTTANTASLGGTWSETGNYPSNFTGSTLNLVGTYSINIAEVAPSALSGVASATFQVGLTDKTTYLRNEVVQMTATGYLSQDNVTIDAVLGGTNAPGFPTWTQATTAGVASFTWQSHPNTPLGNYTLSLSGKTTPTKNPNDTQHFLMYPTNTTTLSLWVGMGTVSRSNTLELRFNTSYINGGKVTTGSAQVQLTEPGGATSHFITATYNSTTQSFTGLYPTTLASSTGLWLATLNAKSFDDGNGNIGPPTNVGSAFSVQTATLTVVNQAFNRTYPARTIVPIIATVITPGGTNFTQGTVSALITSNGRTVAGPIGLAYDQTRGKWIGSYTVGSSDPSGTWIVTVSAQDSYGNSGSTVSSFTVPAGSLPQTLSSFITTWLWLLAILAVVGVGFAMLILRRKGVSHREVKLDLQAIHKKAEEVKSDDFLQSIKAQLKRRTDMMAAEKEATERRAMEKHD